MKGIPLVFLFPLLLLTVSCSKADATHELEFKQETQVIFFTDKSQYNYEAPYYDAIIQLRGKFPKPFKNMLVFSPKTAEKYEHAFQVKEFPAILIFHEKDTIVNIQGEQSKEEIVESVSDALESIAQ